MHISAKADYAARALLELAREPSRPLTCEAIASSQQIPFRFLKSVVGELRKAGLVRSQRGCEGGYWLGRPAEDITLLDVALAVDGELITLRGESPAGLDYPGAASGLPGVWRQIEASAAAVLGGVTLLSLLPAGAREQPARKGGRVTDERPLPTVEVVEYTDPLCPWAWGSEPVFRRLRAALAGRVRWRRVYCLLFDLDDDPAPDSAAETAWYAGYVEGISAHTRAPRAHRLSRVAASSWPSSLAAKAAEVQGRDVAERVLRRLRETVFVLGEPADSPALALAAVRGVPGLDLERLSADAASTDVRERVRADRAEARRPVREVLSVADRSPHPGTAKETGDGGHRYALPTLLVRAPAGHRVVPGWRTYEEYAAAVAELHPGLPAAAAPLSPSQALRRYRSLTDPERTVLTEGPWPPREAVRVDTGNGPLWLHPEEAAVHPATCGGARTLP